MKFSVIIPVYNVEDKIERCLDSLLCQEYSDYEIILVNDGSRDNSLDICKYYSEKYSNVKYIDKENGGASSARNAGLEIAKGEFILFADSDDYVESNYFSVLSNNALTDGLAVFTYRIINNKNDYVRKVPDICLAESASFFEKSKALISSRTINSPCSKIFSKKIIDEYNLRFDEKMPVAEDFNFGLAYLMNSRFVNVYDISVYVYDMTNEKSLVKKQKDGLINIYPYVFDVAYSTISTSDFTIEEKNELYIIWDKLHTDSFATCVMEEIKSSRKTGSKIKNIRSFCEIFYIKYNKVYGYQNITHYIVRFCIKHKLALILYILGNIYIKLRGH